MILSFNLKLFYGDVYHTIPVTCIFTQTENISENCQIFKCKSGVSRKLVTVRRALNVCENHEQNNILQNLT